MEARFFSTALIVLSLLSLGANYRTPNFAIKAATPQLAKEIGDTAESYRVTLAREWLGHDLPPWSDVCPVTVTAGPHLGAGGATSFMFENGRPFGWRMNIQGSRERLLDSVVPHEVSHMILATHFGRPLPRWADEGACTTVEHASERQKQHQLLYTFLTTGRGIAFNQMFAMKEYPEDILPLYSQAYSLANFLIAQGGRRKFVDYIGDGMRSNNWTAATRQHYGLHSLSDLQITWLDWVRRGSPALAPDTTLIAAQGPAQGAPLAAPAPVNFDDGPRATPVGPSGPAIAARTPTTNQDSPRPAPADNSGEGWYARQRDLARSKALAAVGIGHDSAVSAPVTPAKGVPPLSSVARPQAIGQPQPMVLAPAGAAFDPYRPVVVPQRTATSLPALNPPTVWR